MASVITRACGVHIYDPRSLIRAARKRFPGSRANQKIWMRFYLENMNREFIPRVKIGCAIDIEQFRFVRQSGIPHGTPFQVSQRVVEWRERDLNLDLQVLRLGY